MNNLSYNLLSKHRSKLMGFAMLWIMLYHAQGPSLPFGLDRIRYAGFGGVDIFLLLSGLGLYMSLSKNNNMKEFYKKRVLRILPAFLIVVNIYSLVVYLNGYIDLGTVFMNVSTLYFWFNVKGGFNWYIPSLLAFYLLTPFYYNLFYKAKNKEKFTLISLVIALVIGAVVRILQGYYLIYFISRMPIFLIGFLIAYYLKSNKIITKSNILFYILCLAIGSAFLYYIIVKVTGIKEGYYPFILIIVPLCLILSYIFEKISNIKFIVNSLGFLGDNSLYIYLINVCMTRAHYELIKYLLINENYFIYHAICFILTIILAMILKHSDKLVCRSLKNRLC